ncbi:MAG: hypothetical protein SFV53_05885 [Rickettsiales bacterium]|nr:hypothetical protein [Rickettsiales bacterium]
MSLILATCEKFGVAILRPNLLRHLCVTLSFAANFMVTSLSTLHRCFYSLRFVLAPLFKIFYLILLLFVTSCFGGDPYLYDRTGFDENTRPVVMPNPKTNFGANSGANFGANAGASFEAVNSPPQYYRQDLPRPSNYQGVYQQLPQTYVTPYQQNYQPMPQPVYAAPPIPSYPNQYQAVGGSRYYSNPYSIPPSNYNQYYDGDQYYVPPTYYNNVEQNFIDQRRAAASTTQQKY